MLVTSDISLTAGETVTSITAHEVKVGWEGELLPIIGQQQPLIAVRAGERERWRVVNACTYRYVQLAIPGHQLELLGIHTSQQPAPRESQNFSWLRVTAPTCS